jgi:competence protein ComEA
MGLPLPHPLRATVARGAIWHLWGIACLWAGSVLSAHALEINQASEAELDSVRGMGPAMSRAILAERQRQPFTDWADLMRRVKGIRSASAERFAAQGLTVNGQTWSAPPPAKP